MLRAVALIGVAWTVTAHAARAGDAFEDSVRPVLAEHCLRCHGPDKQKGGLRLDSREAMLAGGDSGPAVVPGKPGDSPLVEAVRHDGLEMPPDKKLPDAVVATLTQWVKDGAKWGAADPTPAAPGQSARRPGRITDADRGWWAFQRPMRPALPPDSEGRAASPVDHFIARRLTAEKLAPAPEADRVTLIRRATYDLTGLPPTPDEVRDFLADDSSDAYGRLVDRLLASPRYGERQARAWLDLVRYGESDGYRADAARPHAWRYRDYVVRAFNADKGYDRFLTEQLAGDEVAPADPDALVATGYLRLWPYEYNQKDVRGQLAAIRNDLTDVTADTFLGLGMGCARCHDHKFDPILQKDYFALQAFFGGLAFPDVPVFESPAEEARYAAELAAWEGRTAGLRARMAALVEPALARIRPTVGALYPADVKAILRTPAADRTPTDEPVYQLAMRQVQEMEFGRAPAKLGTAQKAEYDALKAELDASARPVAPLAMVARDFGPRATDTVIPGGRKKAVAVEPAFPTVLGYPEPAVAPTAGSTGRRAALAAWLTRPDHPLTARVMVNRLWQGHFGTGLVTTASDYGLLGEKPTHPELLDWLAAEFVDSGWSVKHVHRLIVTSATYRRASRGPARSVDPENRFLACFPVRRLDAEQVRDAMLAVSGELDPTAGGPAVPAEKPRRSVFTAVRRNAPDALLAAFDAADGLTGCARRNVTVTPTQSLLLLNGPGPLARANAFAARVMPASGSDAAEGVEAAYQLAFGRPPTAAESAEALKFLRQQAGAASGKAVTAAGRKRAWGDFCHALMNANEFFYVD
jgi:hypothetical protein